MTHPWFAIERSGLTREWTLIDWQPFATVPQMEYSWHGIPARLPREALVYPEESFGSGLVVLHDTLFA